jgi:hypothetical protein
MSSTSRYFLALALAVPGAIAALSAVSLLPYRDVGLPAEAGVLIFLVLVVAAGLAPGWRALGAALIVASAGTSVALLIGASHGVITPPVSPMLASLVSAPIAWRVSRRHPRHAPRPEPDALLEHASTPARREECA